MTGWPLRLTQRKGPRAQGRSNSWGCLPSTFWTQWVPRVTFFVTSYVNATQRQLAVHFCWFFQSLGDGFVISLLSPFSRIRLCNPMDCTLPAFSVDRVFAGKPCPPPGDLPNPGIGLGPPALQADFLASKPREKPTTEYTCVYIYTYTRMYIPDLYLCVMYRHTHIYTCSGLPWWHQR